MTSKLFLSVETCCKRLEIMPNTHGFDGRYDTLVAVKMPQYVSGITFHEQFHPYNKCKLDEICYRAWRPFYLIEARKWINENIKEQFRGKYRFFLYEMQTNPHLWMVKEWA